MTANPATEAELRPDETSSARPGDGGKPGFAHAFAPLLVVFVSTRLLTIVLLRPGGFFGDWSDYYYFKEMAELSNQGYFPYVHYWVEYPPAFPWLLVGAYRLSLLLPVWKHPLLWFQLILSGVLLLSDVGNLWLIRRIGARLWGESGGLQCSWLYAGLFLPLYALSTWFDTLSVFWLLLGLELLLLRRPLLAGLSCGCGIAVKLYPVLLAPVAVRATRGIGGWVRFAAAAAVVPIAVSLPFYLLSPTMLLASLRGLLNRRPWESIWALLDGYYGTGGVPALQDRLLYPDSALWQTPSRLPWTAISLVFAAIYAVIWWWAGRPRPASDRAATAVSPPDAVQHKEGKPAPGLSRSAVGMAFGRLSQIVAVNLLRTQADGRSIVLLAGITVALFLLYSKGFSQQFTLLLLPFVVLVAPTLRGVLYAAALMVNNTLVEGYLYVNVFPDDRWLLRATVGVRTLLLALFVVEASSLLIPWLNRPWRRFKPAATWALACGLLALGLFGAIRLSGAYWETSTVHSPQAAAIRAVQDTAPETVLLFAQQPLYSALYPYVRPRSAYLMADPRLPERIGRSSLHARLIEFAGDRQAVLLVEDAGQIRSPLIQDVQRWLERSYQLAETRTEAGVRLTRYVRRDRRAFPEPAVFGGAIALDWAEFAPAAVRPGGEIRVLLGWRAISRLDRDYTVFVHLLDGEERLVAQQDSPPLGNRYPTSGWRVGEVVADELTLAVPASLADGEYHLAIGLYHQPTMERLQARGGPARDDRVLLHPVRVARWSPGGQVSR